MQAASPLALWAAALFALDPVAFGGLRLRAGAGPARDAWLAALRERLAAGTPWQRLPLAITDDRLLGGLDLVATLAARRSVAMPGLLAQCHGGVVVVPMAERLPRRVAVQLAAALDRREVALEREGFALVQPAAIAVLALDEALPDDEPLAPLLAERLAFDVALAEPAPADARPDPSSGSGSDRRAGTEPVLPPLPPAAAMAAARAALREVVVPPRLVELLCGSAAVLGVDSARAGWFALHATRAAAALAGHCEADEADAQLALALVLAPRATRLPPPADAAEPEAPEGPDAEPPPETESAAAQTPDDPPAPELGADTERQVAAALAQLPPGLLASLTQATALRRRSAREGRSGALFSSQQRGRPLASRPGDPRRGARLSLIDTLRAAAPWQRLRAGDAVAQAGADMPAPAPTGRQAQAHAGGAAAPQRLHLRPDDLRVVRRAQRSASVTLFLVDASGSAALHRLAEAKGAVELLLAESYARRDEVAVIAFRGQTAQLLLPPTRSLVRARRALAGLPGGGGTPLAAALDAAREQIQLLLRRGATPSVVLLSDGRANVPRAGSAPGRAQAEADALAAARALAALPARCLVIDTAPQPGPAAGRIAEALRARYLPLPHARAEAVSAAARALRG
jgi:magnesium chelatase subunit D